MYLGSDANYNENDISSLSQYKIKKASKNSKPKTKSEIVQEKFGVQ